MNISWQKQRIQGNKSFFIYMIIFGKKVNVHS